MDFDIDYSSDMEWAWAAPAAPVGDDENISGTNMYPRVLSTHDNSVPQSSPHAIQYVNPFHEGTGSYGHINFDQASDIPIGLPDAQNYSTITGNLPYGMVDGWDYGNMVLSTQDVTVLDALAPQPTARTEQEVDPLDHFFSLDLPSFTPPLQEFTAPSQQFQTQEQLSYNIPMMLGGLGAVLHDETLGSLEQAAPVASAPAASWIAATPPNAPPGNGEEHEMADTLNNVPEAAFIGPVLVLETVSNEMLGDLERAASYAWVTLGGNLEQARMVLELTLEIYPSKDQLKRLFRKWHRGKNDKTGHGHHRLEASRRRTRPKRAALRLEPVPAYVLLSRRPSIPRPLRPRLYECQALLLLSIDKYVKGFFDSLDEKKLQTQLGCQSRLGFETEWQWRTLLSHCQGVSALVRKNRSHLPAPSDVFSRAKRTGMLRGIVDGILNDQVFCKLPRAASACRPHILGQFWNICRVLQGLAPQAGYYADVEVIYATEFVRSVRTSLTQSPGGTNAGLIDLVDALLSIDPCELQDTMRISCLCTSRALTSSLGHEHPIVLDSWASYYHFWDAKSLDKTKFLNAYKAGFREVERSYGRDHEYTINVLCNYAMAAHYVLHEDGLAARLAQDLWGRTNEAPEVQAWTVNSRGMAESARILALLSCMKHENKRKCRTEMRKIRNRLSLKGRAARRRWRKTLETPPSPDQVLPGIYRLDKTIRRLGDTEWACSLIASSLADFSARLKLEFLQDPAAASSAAQTHFELAAEIRRDMILGKEPVRPDSPPRSPHGLPM